MVRRLILAISIALLIIAGLSLLFFAGESFTFFELLDKLTNGELFKEEREYPVNVNVYEMKMGGAAELRFDRAFADHRDLEDALRLYFTETGNALGTLTEISEGEDNREALLKLYEKYSVSESVDMLLLERQVKTRLQSPVDLRFDVCDIGLQLVSISFGAEDFVELRVRECFAAVFNGIPDKLSTYTGVEHFFVFDKREGDWLIKRHERNTALSAYITGELEKLAGADGLTLDGLDASALNDYAAQLKTVLNRDTRYYGAEDSSDLPAAPHGYDRDSAVEYAMNFTQRERVKRNAEFPKYERNGTNFTSQCLMGGGIPSDGRWKAEDGSAAGERFNAADKFYEYVTSPDSHIRARVCDYADGEPGDIVQFIDGGGGASHSALITYAARGNSAEKVEFLVTANSEELRNFPLSALGFDIMRLIKIEGYFESWELEDSENAE